jgi:hypothetical protein
LTHNPDVIIGTESCLREEISNAEVFMDDYTTFRRDRNTGGGGVFICVKNFIACTELWVDEDFELIAVDVNVMDPKFTWKIVGTDRAPNENMRVIEKLAARTDYLGSSIKRIIMGRDLNMPSADWNGNAEYTSGSQASVIRLVWENGYTQVEGSPTRGDALLDVYLVLPEGSFTSCSIVHGISDHCEVLLEVEWEENYCRPQVERLLPVYHKANVLGLQNFLRDKFAIWARNGRCVEEIWNNFKNIIFESIGRFIPHNTLRKNSDPEYYNKGSEKDKVNGQESI